MILQDTLLMESLVYSPQKSSYQAYMKAEAMCDIIMADVFKPCHGKVNPASFKTMCMQDVALCNYNKFSDCMCSSLSMYAKVCHAEGVTLKWRRNGLCRE